MDPQAPTWGTRAGDNELAKSLLYPAAPEPVESSIQGEADPEANVDDVHTELVLAPEDFPTPQARHDPSRGAKDPSMHYQQHYLHVRKHYAFWRDNVVTSPQSTEAQNNLWEHAYTGKTKADVSALSGASLLAMALKPNPQGLLAAHLAAVGGQTDLLFRIGDSATGSQASKALNAPSEDTVRGSPLHWACAAGKADSVAVLIQLGADVDARDHLGATPIMLAAMHHHTLLVCMLARLRANVHLQDCLGCTAATWAAFADSRDVLAVLLHFGASFAAADVYGQTALHAAVAGGSAQCVQYLLWLGADQLLQDRGGWSARLMAKWRRLDLVKKGGKVTVKTYRIEMLMFSVGRRQHKLQGETFGEDRSQYVPGRSRAGMYGLLLNCAFGYYVYFSQVFPAGASVLPGSHSAVYIQGLHWLHLVLHVLVWYYFFKTRGDDGALPLRQDAYEHNMQEMTRCGFPVSHPATMLDYCHICRLVRPKDRPVKHCSLCMRCIPGQDHHCSLVDRCVGFKNRNYFIGYTASLAGACIVFCMIGAHALDQGEKRMWLLTLAWWDFACGAVVNIVLVIRQLAFKHKQQR